MNGCEVWGSAGEFFDQLQALTSEMTLRFRRRDIRGMKAILSNLAEIESYVRDEDYRSPFSTATARCVLLLAEAQIDMLRFDQGIGLCARAKAVLEDKARRRAGAGLPARPDTVTWSYVGAVAAEAKWKGPPEIRDSVMTPGGLVDHYYSCEHRIRRGLAARALPDPSKEGEIKEQLFWQGLTTIKMAMRYAPDAAAEIADHFNHWHGGPLDDADSFAFIDLEIARLHFKRSLTSRLAVALHTRRRKALRAMIGAESDLSAYDASAARERDYLLKRQPALFEVSQPPEIASSA